MSMPFKKVVFYYSSKVKPEPKYECNIDNVMARIKGFEKTGAKVELIDMETVKDPFRMYTYASTGPAASRRNVLGAVRGADYRDFFGKTIPVLAFFENEDDRRPFEVLPRMDERKGGVLLVEEAIERYLNEGVS